MAKPEEKRAAFRLRRKGKSLKNISELLNVSKSSVSLWCRDIRLTAVQVKRLREEQIKAGVSGRIIGAESNKRKRLETIAQYQKDGQHVVNQLSIRDKSMIGIGLYWGEGIKSNSGSAAIVNSDPTVILFAKNWFQECLGVSAYDFRPYIFISEAHRSRKRKIMRYWSRLLKIPEPQFYGIVFIKGKPRKVYENHNSYYGVLALRIRKGTHLKYRILGLIGACKEAAGVAQMVGAQHS